MRGHDEAAPTRQPSLGRIAARNIGWFPTSVTGRQPELAEAQAFLETVRSGPAGLVIEGEPGIGKSVLAAEVARRATALGYPVLTCRGFEAEVRFEYAGLGDLLAALPGVPPPGMPAAQRHALDVAMRRAAADVPIDVALVGTALLGVLTDLAAGQPVILVIDDGQWLDPSTAAALAFAIRRLAGQCVGVLTTRRTGAVDGLPDLGQTMPRVRQLDLGPLSANEVYELIVDRAGRRLGRSQLRQLYRASGGNPYYALELSRWDAASPGLPRTLTEAVAGRLPAMDSPMWPVLYGVAASARPSVSRLRRAFGDGVEDVLTSAEGIGVLRLSGERVEFTHPLLGSVLLDRTPAPERRRVHAKLAEAEPEPEAAARHLALATIGTCAPVADALESAAAETMKRGGAAATVADLLRLAVAMTPEGDAGDERRRNGKLAAALFNAGDLHAAGGLLDRLLPGLAEGRAKAETLSVRSAVAWFQGDPIAAREFAEAALPGARDDARLLGELHGRLSVYATADARLALHHSAAAVAALEQSTNDDLRAAALSNLFLAEVLTGLTPRPELLERAVAIEDPAGSTDQSTVPGSWHTALGRYDLARGRFRLLLDRDRARGDLSSEPILLCHLAETELAAGDWDAAAEYAHASGQAHRINGGEGDGHSARTIAHLAALRGDHEAARSAARAHLGRLRQTGEHIRALGWIQVLTVASAAEADHAEVLRLTGMWVEHLAIAGIVEPMSGRDPGPERLPALIATHALDEASLLLGELVRRHAKIPRPWLDAAIVRGEALLAAADGGVPEGIALIEAARTPGWSPFDRARTSLLRGQLLRRARKANAAAEAFSEAGNLFTQLGAKVWAAAARTERERLGLKRNGGPVLTATERQVAGLSAAGRTNREVAAQLHISPKTVEAHLSRIYRKLGIRSRAELGRTAKGIEGTGSV